jgi:hypothetical protein
VRLPKYFVRESILGLHTSRWKRAPMHGGRLKIAKVGLDKNPKTALAHGVRSAPTIRDASQETFNSMQCRITLELRHDARDRCPGAPARFNGPS